jgi:serine protease Do
MNKKIMFCGLMLMAFSTITQAQEASDSSKKEERKIIIRKSPRGNTADKKVVIIEKDEKILNDDVAKDYGIKKEKKITIMVDGDKVTINGKPVENFSEKELNDLDVDANHLGMIAPHLNGMHQFKFKGNGRMPLDGNDMDFEIFGDMNKPQNKALLGVVTEKDEKGAKIIEITKESAAEKAGLQKGDIITKINNDDITNSNDLVKAIGKYNPEDKIDITYIRDGKTTTTSSTLTKNKMQMEKVFKWNDMDKMVEEMPRMMAPLMERRGMGMMNKPKLGIKVQDVEEGEGVKILEVDENSAAAKAGLQKDDVVTAINNENCKNVDDLRAKTRALKEGEMYKVNFTRKGKKQTAEIKFPKKLKTADL